MSTLIVDTALDVVNASDGLTSLREAISIAQSAAGDDRIAFDNAVFVADSAAGQRTILLETGELLILGGDGALTIDGDLDDDGRADIVIDAQQSSRVIDATAELLLEGLIITGGHVVGDDVEGGGIRAEDLTLRGSQVRGNTVEGDAARGGGIFAENVTLIDSRIADNIALGGFRGEAQGGGIDAGTLSLTRSVVVRNDAEAEAGAAFGGGVHAATLAVTDSVLRDNSTYGDTASGGGFDAGTVTITGSALRGNECYSPGEASGGGGRAATANITGTIIFGNDVFGYLGEGGYDGSLRGGGLVIGTGQVSNSIIAGNGVGLGAGGSGGGISAGSVTIEGSRISGNAVDNGYASFGGGVSARDLTLTDSRVVRNLCFAGDYRYSSDAGGGGVAASAATIIGSLIANNSIDGPYADGGGIFTGNSGTLTIARSTISGNRATGSYVYGGGIRAGTVTIAASTINGNSAEGFRYSSGGITATTADLTNVTLSGNQGGGLDALSITLLHTTITGNIGGGVSGTIVARNSLIIGNAIDGATDISGLNPVLQNTLVGGDASLVFAETVEITAGGDVILAGVLADNGGPTQTVALRDDATNPALDAGSPALATETDQRGVPRGTPPDLGAFELATAAPVAIDDAFRISEDGPARSRNLLRSDSDADTGANDPELTVVAVNGAAATVGTSIVIGAGLLVLIDADGQVTFDPAGAYELLTRGELATERFTYTVEDADGLTDVGEVVITIAGRDELILFG